MALPTFDNGNNLVINLPENTATLPYITHATDPSGLPIFYEIIGGIDADKFGIDFASGQLTFLSAPNFENPTDAIDQNNLYGVTIRANGSGGSAQQDVNIWITDVNEGGPTITSDGGAQNFSVSRVEGITFITDVNATDPDTSQTLHYSLLGGQDADLFTIDEFTGQLRFSFHPDFEHPTDVSLPAQDNVYTATLAVQDFFGGIDTQQFFVTVTDDPIDNPPPNTPPDFQTQGQTITREISENTIGVTQFIAQDTDLVAYSIVPNVGDWDKFNVTVDEQNIATLSFISLPDFETPQDFDNGLGSRDNIYDVTVQADDGHGGITQQPFQVTVADVNDDPTIISDGGGNHADVFVAENQTAVTTIQATDQDPGQHITYGLDTSFGDAALFDINSESGVITYKDAPDFETSPSFHRIVAFADDGVSLTPQTIDIHAQDVNEAPVFRAGSNPNALVDENTTAVNYTFGAPIGAIDPEGQALTYSIVANGWDGDKFNIDTATGALSFKVAPDFENPTDINNVISGAHDNQYDVLIRADDGQGGPTADQQVEILVKDVVETPPPPVDQTLSGSNKTNDKLESGAGNDTLNGLKGDDILIGHKGNDTLHGGDGKDILAAGPGSNKVDGGAGTDYMLFAGVKADYGFTFDKKGALTSVTGPDTLKTTVSGIEVYHFEDGHNYQVSGGALTETNDTTINPYLAGQGATHDWLI